MEITLLDVYRQRVKPLPSYIHFGLGMERIKKPLKENLPQVRKQLNCSHCTTERDEKGTALIRGGRKVCVTILECSPTSYR